MQAFQLCVIGVASREVAQSDDLQLGKAAQVTETIWRHSRTVCKYIQTGTATTADWGTFNTSLIWEWRVLVHIADSTLYSLV